MLSRVMVTFPAVLTESASWLEVLPVIWTKKESLARGAGGKGAGDGDDGIAGGISVGVELIVHSGDGPGVVHVGAGGADEGLADHGGIAHALPEPGGGDDEGGGGGAGGGLCDEAAVGEFKGAALCEEVVDDVSLCVAGGAADVDAEGLVGFSGGVADGELNGFGDDGGERVGGGGGGECERGVPGGGGGGELWSGGEGRVRPCGER